MSNDKSDATYWGEDDLAALRRRMGYTTPPAEPEPLRPNDYAGHTPAPQSFDEVEEEVAKEFAYVVRSPRVPWWDRPVVSTCLTFLAVAVIVIIALVVGS